MRMATDLRPRRLSIKHAAWWNQDCADHIDLIRSLTGDAKRQVQRRTKSVFRQAKRECYTAICEAATPETIWKMSKWGTGTRTLPIPPLVDGDRLAMTPEERCRASRATWHCQLLIRK